jgi:hypothetical protein
MKNLPEAPVKKERISRKTLSPSVAKVMKRLHFPLDVVLRCVRWYVAYSLSLRDLEEMIAEHGVETARGATARNRAEYRGHTVATLLIASLALFRHHALPAEVLQAATRDAD